MRPARLPWRTRRRRTPRRGPTWTSRPWGGRGPAAGATASAPGWRRPRPRTAARRETLALLERALGEEAERASVTHDGSRQLFVATSLIPRTVVPPQWVEFGSASVFETPKGPFPEAPIGAAVAIYPGVGGPSWA